MKFFLLHRSFQDTEHLSFTSWLSFRAVSCERSSRLGRSSLAPVTARGWHVARRCKEIDWGFSGVGEVDVSSCTWSAGPLRYSWSSPVETSARSMSEWSEDGSSKKQAPIAMHSCMRITKTSLASVLITRLEIGCFSCCTN